MKVFETIKNNGEKSIVALCKYKDTGGYSFVDLTIGNIIEYKFAYEKYAIEYLEEYIKKGLIKSYKQIGEW